jgi:hypothetical protein
MLRFILRREMFSEVNQQRGRSMETLDAECPALERALMRGGCGESWFDQTELLGVVILPAKEITP